MTKTENLVIDVIRGYKKFNVLYYKNKYNYNRKKNVEKAIIKLKEKNIIYFNANTCCLELTLKGKSI
jgi:hypothetical protein